MWLAPTLYMLLSNQMCPVFLLPHPVLLTAQDAVLLFLNPLIQRMRVIIHQRLALAALIGWQMNTLSFDILKSDVVFDQPCSICSTYTINRTHFLELKTYGRVHL